MGRIHFALRDSSTRNVFLETWIYSKYFETLRPVFLNSSFRNIPGIKIVQDWTLNAFHGCQALAAALKVNTTVVDINLCSNYGCGDEGAEVR